MIIVVVFTLPDANNAYDRVIVKPVRFAPP